jgi:hypothetical protein
MSSSEGISESLYWIKHKSSDETYNRDTDSLEAISYFLRGFDVSWMASQLLIDADDFDVPSATADNERWTPEYITGADRGSADIDTTVSDKLYMKLDVTAGDGAREYAVARELPILMRHFTVYTDVSYTWGTISANDLLGGIMVSAGSAYDSTNYIRIFKEKATGVERLRISSNLNGAGDTEVAVLDITDDSLALKIERNDNIWRLYYSTDQASDAVWVLAGQIEDPNEYMTETVSYYQFIYSSGTLSTDDIQMDVDTYRLGNTFGAFSDRIGSPIQAPTAPGAAGSLHSKIRGIMQALNITDSGTGSGLEIDGTANLVDALGTDAVTVTDSATSVLGAIGANNNNNAFASTSVVANHDGSVLERLEGMLNTNIEAGDIVIYLAAEDISTTEITDDGSSPALLSQVSQSTKTEGEGEATPAWTEDYNIDQNGTLNLISIFYNLEWQQKFTVGAGAGTTTSVKWQISGDGGGSWVDVTDSVTENSATYIDKQRMGAGLHITSITGGANQLQMRLCSWTDDAGGVSTVESKVYSNSYVRLTLRKS